MPTAPGTVTSGRLPRWRSHRRAAPPALWRRRHSTPPTGQPVCHPAGNGPGDGRAVPHRAAVRPAGDCAHARGLRQFTRRILSCPGCQKAQKQIAIAFQIHLCALQKRRRKGRPGCTGAAPLYCILFWKNGRSLPPSVGGLRGGGGDVGGSHIAGFRQAFQPGLIVGGGGVGEGETVPGEVVACGGQNPLEISQHGIHIRLGGCGGPESLQIQLAGNAVQHFPGKRGIQRHMIQKGFCQLLLFGFVRGISQYDRTAVGGINISMSSRSHFVYSLPSRSISGIPIQLSPISAPVRTALDAWHISASGTTMLISTRRFHSGFTAIPVVLTLTISFSASVRSTPTVIFCLSGRYKSTIRRASFFSLYVSCVRHTTAPSKQQLSISARVIATLPLSFLPGPRVSVGHHLSRGRTVCIQLQNLL